MDATRKKKDVFVLGQGSFLTGMVELEGKLLFPCFSLFFFHCHDLFFSEPATSSRLVYAYTKEWGSTWDNNKRQTPIREHDGAMMEGQDLLEKRLPNLVEAT